MLTGRVPLIDTVVRTATLNGLGPGAYLRDVLGRIADHPINRIGETPAAEGCRMADIARLRIDLDEVSPRVWRRVEVPVDIGLDDLHLVIQAVMGWENAHLYEFRRGRTVYGYGIPDPEWDIPGSDLLPAEEARLRDLLGRRAKVFTYVYDFGDDWRHTVRVEARTPAAPDTPYPRFLGGEGRCPPEDIGGPWGYAEFLAAIADPAHERHDEFLDWCGGAFDPTDIGEVAIRQELGKLAGVSPGARTSPR